MIFQRPLWAKAFIEQISVILWQINTKLESYLGPTVNTMYLPKCLELNTKLEIQQPWILCIRYSEKAVNRATFVWSNWSKIFPVETISKKINTQHLWNHCGSSHSFYVSFIIAYTKD